MISENDTTFITNRRDLLKGLIGVILLTLTCPFNIFSENPVSEPLSGAAIAALPDSIPVSAPVVEPADVVEDSFDIDGDSVYFEPVDTLDIIAPLSLNLPGDSPRRTTASSQYLFSPDPTRAVWMSALFPGLGQLYNRRFWKLPIVIGGFMGLGYATSWNNGMLRDYTRAYADIMDNDPNTKSYMDFFPSTTTESSLDKTWLTNVLRSRKNYYRRNRDLCIICMVGVYLLAMIDAYVDASLAHFDISPDLSMDLVPTLIPDDRTARPGVGIQWAFNF